MKTRTRKRYYTANQIRDDIDKWKAKAQKLRDAGAALDRKADMLFACGDVLLRADANYARETAEKRRASAGRIETRKLVKLKEKLAEFLTDPLPGTGAGKDVES